MIWTPLAFESTFVWTFYSLFFCFTWLMLWWRLRHRYMIMLALGWFLMIFYWALLAISAGPSPVIERVGVAMHIRVISLAGGTILVCGKWTMLWQMWRQAQKHQAVLDAQHQEVEEREPAT